jgi:phosphoglycolate phosphatase-like HAD superfamily hydrolase
MIHASRLWQSRFWLVFILLSPALARAADDLRSWQDTAPRQAIVQFVEEVTKEGSPDFIPVPSRIAVFDNDGTLWSEQPLYFQVLFALDEVRRMAPAHPEWKTTQPFQAVLENDHKALAATGMHGMNKIIGATHTGMSSDTFNASVKAWLATARHPKSGRPYTEMVYQPMLELLDYLRAHQFKLFIVSGGEVGFMRVWAEEVYGIPPEQVIGSRFVGQFQDREGDLQIIRTAKLEHNDDGPGKPESIDALIGRRPVLAFGNSDGDLQMLQWTAAGKGKSFVGLLHHTDAKREWAYDRTSDIGRLDKALDAAQNHHWNVVDMAADWKQIYPFD